MKISSIVPILQAVLREIIDSAPKCPEDKAPPDVCYEWALWKQARVLLEATLKTFDNLKELELKP